MGSIYQAGVCSWPGIGRNLPLIRVIDFKKCANERVNLGFIVPVHLG